VVRRLVWKRSAVGFVADVLELWVEWRSQGLVISEASVAIVDVVASGSGGSSLAGLSVLG